MDILLEGGRLSLVQLLYRALLAVFLYLNVARVFFGPNRTLPRK
jgi:hypothetical protein